MADRYSRPHAARIFLIAGIILLWAGLVVARLVHLHVARHDELLEMAEKAQSRTESISAPRGAIYDRNMEELATSVSVPMVVAEPRVIINKPAAAASLAPIVGMKVPEILDLLHDPKRPSYRVIRRRLSPEVKPLIEKLALQGIYTIDESMRFFPGMDLACHVLGFVNMNGDGVSGVEEQYHKLLAGTPGLFTTDVDAHGRTLSGKFVKEPVPGHSLVLSLDRSIQYIAARELAAAVQKSRAVAGTVIVMETQTGQIRAFANHPQYDGNTFNEYTQYYLRNRAVADYFEPGSTFKVVVAAAAMEAGLVRSGERIDCQMGSITIGKHVFHDHKPYGLLSFAQILENSSNVGAAKLGLRLGDQRLYDAIRAFGFGSPTGIDIPGEIAGRVRKPERWSALSIGAISFGQEVGVTALQILGAINCIANGGYRVRPTVVDTVISADGERVSSRSLERTRILRHETAAAVRDAFEGVVLRGTGKQAALEGYRAAGKTGTAQKIVSGRYSDTKYLASFVGFAPLPNPRLTVLVMIDEPKGAIYGGEVAAPVFRSIMQEALMQLQVPPDNSLPRPRFNLAMAADIAEDYLPNATPVIPSVNRDEAESGEGGSDEAIVMPASAASVTVPDFKGLAMRKVLEKCLELGIRMEGSGSGVAVYQIPLPGMRMAAGEVCYVTFARSAAAFRGLVPGLEDADAMARNRTQAAIGATRP